MALGTRFKLSQTGLQFVQDACAGRARGAAAGTAPVWEIFALRRLHRFPGPSLGCHDRNGVLPREGPRGGPSYPLKPHCASSVGRVVAPARTQGPQRVVRRGIDVGVGVLATTQPHHQAEHHAVVAVQYLVQVSVVTQRRSDRASSSLIKCSRKHFPNSAPAAETRGLLAFLAAFLPEGNSNLAPTVRFTMTGRPSRA